MAKPKKRPEIKSLYYITHVDNLRSILERGILSHRIVNERGLEYRAIYDQEIVSNREHKNVPDGRSLWEFANVYFQARNPMLYRVVKERDVNEIVVLGIDPKILTTVGVYVTDGNAANNATSIRSYRDGIEAVFQNWETISSEYWNASDGSKRKIMAECLVPGHIPAEFVRTVYVANYKVATQVKALIGRRSIDVIPEPYIFFNPIHRYRITDNISLVDGDMFFSSMQTLTISVNTVGIMGKGLASRAKYQFPDVYVMYQDACRSKSLKMGQPYLYKREGSIEADMTDEPSSSTYANGVKWFLLFATKRRWQEDSDIDGIEQGLRWIAANYRAEGIESIALPALGCGLGNLDWKDVGPMMCRHLAPLGIQVVIYLPREREIPDEYLSSKYLLQSPSS